MTVLRFGMFEVDSASGELRKGGSRVRLSEQPLRLLLALLDQPGQIVTREQLRQRLWPDGTFVNFDRAINKAVSELRGVIGDSADMPGSRTPACCLVSGDSGRQTWRSAPLGEPPSVHSS